MIIVEVKLADSFEIHNIPSVPNLPWGDNNILAMQTVYDRLVATGVRLDGLELVARNLNWQREHGL